MSKVKINQDQFLGKHELNRAFDFVTKDGYKSVFQQSVASYGVVKLPIDVNFDNLRIIQGSDNSKISLNAGLAINKEIERILVSSLQGDILTIPADDVFHKVVISYFTTNIEEGEVQLLANGSLVGVGTEFTKVLRGQPKHPVKIRLTNSANNTQEYEVFSVANDTSAKIIGASFTAENNLKYRVVGTFAPNVGVPLINKNIYVFDYFQVELKDAEYVLTKDYEFHLADVKNNGTTLTIQDARSNNLYSLNYTNSSTADEQLFQANPYLGVENIKYDHIKSSKSENLVQVGWGLRSGVFGWIPDTPNNKFTVQSLDGFGTITNLNQIPDDSLIGWRVYFNNGKHRKVASNSYDGSELTVTINDFNPAEISLDGIVTIVPDLDAIEFRFSTGALNKNTQYFFHISRGFAYMRVPVGSTVGRYRNIVGDKAGGVFGFNNGGYLNEQSFDDNGLQTGNFFSGVFDNTFTIATHPDNFYDMKGWLNKDNSWAAENDFYDIVRFVNQAIIMETGNFTNLGSINLYGDIFHVAADHLIINDTFDNLPVFYHKSRIDFSTNTGATIRGIDNGAEGKIITLFVKGDQGSTGIEIKHNDLAASIGNRIILPAEKSIFLKKGHKMQLVYQGNHWRYWGGTTGFEIVQTAGLNNSVILDTLIGVNLEGSSIPITTTVQYKGVRYRILDNIAHFQVRVNVEYGGGAIDDIEINTIKIGFPTIFQGDNFLELNTFDGNLNDAIQFVGLIRERDGALGTETTSPCHVEIVPKIGVNPPLIIAKDTFGSSWKFKDVDTPIVFTCSFSLFLNN